MVTQINISLSSKMDRYIEKAYTENKYILVEKIRKHCLKHNKPEKSKSELVNKLDKAIKNAASDSDCSWKTASRDEKKKELKKIYKDVREVKMSIDSSNEFYDSDNSVASLDLSVW
ncbi:uncharacterized protein LOC106060441 isoform X2 [Biomphalaria glabrata]|uniref:Uncharacterized protein LOC106060441 isoform X2 n=1 Tax=Biomphalaria glabrata TaxID=6526 RepID=A0A9W3BEY2_BIOGL|nr:uncharacterized protein LOC106060441 isoform X2 [Biomphalaria glabrata]